MNSNPMVAMQGVRLFFRLPSDRNYQMAEMQKNGDMYGVLIGCDAIALLDPSAVYYYIRLSEAMDPSLRTRAPSTTPSKSR